MYGEKIMSELIEQMREHCDSKRHDVACKCYHLAEQEFLSRASKSDFWDKIHDVTELDFKGIHRIVITHIIHKNFRGQISCRARRCGHFCRAKSRATHQSTLALRRISHNCLDRRAHYTSKAIC